MKIFSKVLIFLTLLTFSLSWRPFVHQWEYIKEKEQNLSQYIDLDNLNLTSLKDMTLKDLIKLPNFREIIGRFVPFIHRHGSSSSEETQPTPTSGSEESHSSHHSVQNIDDFFTGAFEQFKLPRPTEIIECFGRFTAPIFFRKLRTVNSVLQHSVQNDKTSLQIARTELELFHHVLDHNLKCMHNSRDWQKLTDHLDISSDPEVFKKAMCLYKQARFHVVADDFKELVSELDNKNFKNAGKAWSKFFSRFTTDYKKVGEDILSYQAFGNGLASVFGTSLPDESIKCYDSKHAKLLMDFFRGVSKKVSEGRWHKAHESTSEFWDSEGKALLDKIPKKVWDCDVKSKDSKEISEKLGVDLGSKEFIEKVWKYLGEHNIMFYGYLRSMHHAFEKGDYLEAGIAYGHLLEAVAKHT